MGAVEREDLVAEQPRAGSHEVAGAVLTGL
jgi:hypothetical protein